MFQPTKMMIWLVVSTPLKYMKGSWDESSQYMENQKCLKPPSSDYNIGISQIDMEVCQWARPHMAIIKFCSAQV
jgi:hypothetical protein